MLDQVRHMQVSALASQKDDGAAACIIEVLTTHHQRRRIRHQSWKFEHWAYR